MNIPVNIALLFGGVFALIFLAVGALVVGLGLFALQRRRATASWPQVPAQIETSAVVGERHFKDHDQGVLMYRPRVTYRYAAPGGDYQGDKVAVTGRLYPQEAKAQQVAARYPAGGSAMVRYNPEDPAEAYLQDEGWGGGLALLGFGLLCWIMPVLGARQIGLAWSTIALVLAALVALPVLALRWGRGVSLAAARSRGLCPPAGHCSDADVAALAARGEKILAIRLYRELHGVDLKEARHAVAELKRSGTVPK